MPNNLTNRESPEFILIAKKLIEHWETKEHFSCHLVADELKDQFKAGEIFTVYSQIFPDMTLEKRADTKIKDMPIIREEDLPVQKPESFKELLFEIEPEYNGTRL